MDKATVLKLSKIAGMFSTTPNDVPSNAKPRTETTYGTGDYVADFGPVDANTLKDFQEHYNKFDADPNTPGVQLDYGKFFKDPNTLRHLYDIGQIPEEDYNTFDNNVKQTLNNQYKEYVKGYNGTGTPLGEVEWKKQHAAEHYPLLNNWKMLREMGQHIDYYQGTRGTRYHQTPDSWKARGDWNTKLAEVASNPAAQQLLSSGSFDPASMLQQATANPDQAKKFVNDLQDISTNTNYSWLTKHGPLAQVRAYKDDINNANTLVNSEIFPYMSQFQNMMANGGVNTDTLLSDDNAATLNALNNFAQNPEQMKALQGVAPDMYAQLNANKGRLNFAVNNRDSLKMMNEFSKSPILTLMKSLFSGDPSQLYQIIDTMGRMYAPQTEADLDWSRYVVGNNKQMQDNAAYLPWLRAVGNLRSWFDGNGTRYK